MAKKMKYHNDKITTRIIFNHKILENIFYIEIRDTLNNVFNDSAYIIKDKDKLLGHLVNQGEISIESCKLLRSESIKIDLLSDQEKIKLKKPLDEE